MISERLLNSVVCPQPTCNAHAIPLIVTATNPPSTLSCPNCGRTYSVLSDFLDLMPSASGLHNSLYVEHEAEFAGTLDYKRIGVPLLAAGVRQRAIRRMLKPVAGDRLLELGCGNGKFVFWNRKQVDWAVGIDPAPLFAVESLRELDLCRADARRLPFAEATFSAAMSIDVLEHLPLEDLVLYLNEARRVLEKDGRLFVFSNTREGSRLDFIVRSARRLSRWLGERGVLDDSRDRLRKSDHVKAIETYPELERLLAECGFRVEKVVFWNGLFQSIIENLVVKLAESGMRRVRRKGGDKAPDGEDTMRSQVRARLTQRGPVFRVMQVLTELMWLDLVFFGSWRAGPYFLLARRVEQT